MRCSLASSPSWWRPCIVIALAALMASMLVAGHALADKRCRGTKRLYAGKCRYPDEIQKLEAQAARDRAAAEARRQEAEQQQREAEQRQARDAEACQQARQADTLAAWRVYSAAHPEGSCQREAADRIATLEAEQAEAREPEPPASSPVDATASSPPPTPPALATPGDADEPASSGISPLVYVGFSVGAAGLVTWAVAGGISLATRSALDDECPDKICAPDKEADLDSGAAAAHAATVGLAVGGAGVALGIVGLLLSGSDSSTPSNGAIAVRPTVGLGTLGLGGQF